MKPNRAISAPQMTLPKLQPWPLLPQNKKVAIQAPRVPRPTKPCPETPKQPPILTRVQKKTQNDNEIINEPTIIEPTTPKNNLDLSAVTQESTASIQYCHVQSPNIYAAAVNQLNSFFSFIFFETIAIPIKKFCY